MNELAQALSEKFNLPVDVVWADFETIVQRFIKYETIKSFVAAAIILIFAAIGGYVLKNLIDDFNKCRKTESDTNFFEYEYGSVYPNVFSILTIVCAVVGFMICLPLGIVEILEGIKWILIPEIQIIEWLGM